MTIASLGLTFALILLACGYSAIFFAQLIVLMTTIGLRRAWGIVAATVGLVLFPVALIYAWRAGEPLAYPLRLLLIGTGLLVAGVALGGISLA